MAKASARRFTAHLGFLFTDLPLLDRFAAAADAGFQLVDFSEPTLYPLDGLQRRISEANVRTVQVSTSFGDKEKGEWGLGAIPGREAECRSTCEDLLPYAKALQFKFVHLLAGVVPDGVSFDQAYRTYSNNLRFASEVFGKHGIRVLIEPISPTATEGYFLNSVDLGRRVIRELGDPNIQLLFDVYHVAAMGHNPVAMLHSAVEQTGHIQISDFPGRHEPGTGAVDFQAFFEAMDALGYAGMVCCEYHPMADTRAGLGWMNRFP